VGHQLSVVGHSVSEVAVHCSSSGRSALDVAGNDALQVSSAVVNGTGYCGNVLYMCVCNVDITHDGTKLLDN